MGRWAQYRKRGRGALPPFALDPPEVPGEISGEWNAADGGTLVLTYHSGGPDVDAFVQCEFWHSGGDHNLSSFQIIEGVGNFVDGTGVDIHWRVRWLDDEGNPVSDWSPEQIAEAP